MALCLWLRSEETQFIPGDDDVWVSMGEFDFDRMSEPDIVFDVAKNGFPFLESTVTKIIVGNLVEKLTYRQAENLYQEAYRVLKDDGVIYTDFGEIDAEDMQNLIEQAGLTFLPSGRVAEGLR